MDNVNKLELLKQDFNNFANENGLDLDSVGIILFITMPSGETEVIANPKGYAKLDYIASAYNSDLEHNNNKEVRINSYNFFNNRQEVDIKINLK